jgi:hypothetical protein
MEKPFIQLGPLILNVNQIVSVYHDSGNRQGLADSLDIALAGRNKEGAIRIISLRGDDIPKALAILQKFVEFRDDSITY